MSSETKEEKVRKEKDVWDKLNPWKKDRTPTIDKMEDIAEFPHLFEGTVYLHEENTFYSTHEWSHALDAEMPDFLKKRSVRQNDWQEFLHEIHSVKVSHLIGLFKMFQLPFIILAALLFIITSFLIFSTPLCEIDRNTSEHAALGCTVAWALFIVGLVGFGGVALILQVFIHSFRSRFMAKLKVISDKLQVRFTMENKSYDNETRALSLDLVSYINEVIFCFVFSDPNHPVDTTLSEHSKEEREQIRIYRREIEDKKVADAEKASAENPLV